MGESSRAPAPDALSRQRPPQEGAAQCTRTGLTLRAPTSSGPQGARRPLRGEGGTTAAPAVKPLFAGTDIRRQKAMLLSALVLVRKSLRDTDALVPKLRELGARHVAYGATPEHYIVVGEALIASLAEIAGEAWRPEHELAWGAAFAVIADAILSGARDAEVDLAA
jgi:hemoglobin-like flavoprotein